MSYYNNDSAGGAATEIEESGGTILAVGSVSDGDLLERSGASIVGVAGANHIIEGGGATLSFGAMADTGLVWRNGAALFGGIEAWAVGETCTAGPTIATTTAATSGLDQDSLALVFGSYNWIAAASHKNEVGIRLTKRAGYRASLDFSYRYDGGSWSSCGYLAIPASGKFTVGAASVLSDGTVQGENLTANGDTGNGASGKTRFSNATAAKDSTSATLGETPTSIAAENAAWIKLYVGATVAYIPYWTA